MKALEIGCKYTQLFGSNCFGLKIQQKRSRMKGKLGQRISAKRQTTNNKKVKFKFLPLSPLPFVNFQRPDIKKAHVKHELKEGMGDIN
jgi:hypothetical protein